MAEDKSKDPALAKRALQVLDLTNLDDDCDEAAVKLMAKRALTAHGHVAALCVWPKFVSLAHELTAESDVRIATVVNFPGGSDDMGAVAEMTERAVEDGADEIDMVIPWARFIEGNDEAVSSAVSRVRRAARPSVKVKAIFESGAFEDSEQLRRASLLALDGGADFLKTSTGKYRVGATMRAARVMMEAIRDEDSKAGFKASGGVRTMEQAAGYLSLADELLGEEAVTAERFRFGASGLLDAALAVLNGEPEEAEDKGGY